MSYESFKNNSPMEKAIEIRVYAETSGCAEHIATFYSESAYIISVPKLQAWAKLNGFTSITESES